MHGWSQLFEWGLQPETAVGCALDFLFKARLEVLDLVRDSYEALQDTNALKIGIHVRNVKYALAHSIIGQDVGIMPAVVRLDKMLWEIAQAICDQHMVLYIPALQGKCS